MKQTQFAKYLTYFMVKYLVGERGCSKNTVAAYRDAISLFIIHMRDNHYIKVDHLEFIDITQERIVGFLEWLETERKCSISTRNVRLAAIHAFVRFLIYKSPDYMEEWQRILAIKVKRAPKATVVYLGADGMKLLLAQPDTSTPKGRRDLTLLSLMYDCAGRVQEIADLVPARVNFGKPTLLRVTGKGNKTRLIPLSDQATASLKIYMQENRLLEGKATEYPLFSNGRGSKLTLMAITMILKKYSAAARKINQALIPANVSPHSLRHSKAMMLQQNGVNLICIRDFLGHESVTTTEIYARIDNRQKREAIEKTSLSPDLSEDPSWQKDKGLLNWLESLAK
ncbi:tyrosine-type recombinase/integrase [Chitinophaga sp. LS1]|uniref:tyrosine-type recombinase/integrase n=1 Tax=Chitinophaga sp. LS1 TaxID=3051176 RepID=UPI002AABB553|nr:tyrosine-type recombinase/integrase [Chitinophaga sp. LS1]WPV69651.1 tyrosine-type recombinase/integrase [Chitinophaga sp. LS1]